MLISDGPQSNTGVQKALSSDIKQTNNGFFRRLFSGCLPFGEARASVVSDQVEPMVKSSKRSIDDSKPNDIQEIAGIISMGILSCAAGAKDVQVRQKGLEAIINISRAAGGKNIESMGLTYSNLEDTLEIIKSINSYSVNLLPYLVAGAK